MESGKPYKIIISGGGTGGHIYPAIAIANALKAIRPDTQVLFVGAEGRMEMQKVPAAGYPIIGLNIRGLQRRLTVQNLTFPFKVVGSLLKARRIISDFKPDAAVGVGGYASGPLLFAATLMKVPVLIQEQNSYAGLTNKLLAYGADKICVAYEGMDKYFPGHKVYFIGNPVRKDIGEAHKKRAEAYKYFGLDPNKKTILAIGGSLGARTINQSVDAGLKQLADAGYQLLWQTGKHYFAQAQSAVVLYPNLGLKAFEFINTMDLAYAASDIVISRAGALSVSELALVGKPAILVPSPNVAEDHQTKNAMALVNRQAAILVKDSEAGEKLINQALDLMSNLSLQSTLATNILQLARPDAAINIAQAIFSLVNQH